jgi:transcriptional regulator with XRE-family HTH domain
MYKPKEAKLFGAALKRLLHEKGLSDRQFAKQADLEHSYVSKLLNPKPGKEIAEPRKKTRQKLAKGLGITEQSYWNKLLDAVIRKPKKQYLLLLV